MNNTPDGWADLSALLQSMWRGETPIGAVLMAFVMAVLRIACTGGGWKKMLLEGLMCGALTLSCASVLEYFSGYKSLSIALGGGIGFMGVDAFRAFALRVMASRLGVKNDN